MINPDAYLELESRTAQSNTSKIYIYGKTQMDRTGKKVCINYPEGVGKQSGEKEYIVPNCSLVLALVQEQFSFRVPWTVNEAHNHGMNYGRIDQGGVRYYFYVDGYDIVNENNVKVYCTMDAWHTNPLIGSIKSAKITRCTLQDPSKHNSLLYIERDDAPVDYVPEHNVVSTIGMSTDRRCVFRQFNPENPITSNSQGLPMSGEITVTEVTDTSKLQEYVNEIKDREPEGDIKGTVYDIAEAFIIPSLMDVNTKSNNTFLQEVSIPIVTNTKYYRMNLDPYNSIKCRVGDVEKVWEINDIKSFGSLTENEVTFAIFSRIYPPTIIVAPRKIDSKLSVYTDYTNALVVDNFQKVEIATGTDPYGSMKQNVQNLSTDNVDGLGTAMLGGMTVGGIFATAFMPGGKMVAGGVMIARFVPDLIKSFRTNINNTKQPSAKGKKNDSIIWQGGEEVGITFYTLNPDKTITAMTEDHYATYGYNVGVHIDKQFDVTKYMKDGYGYLMFTPIAMTQSSIYYDTIKAQAENGIQIYDTYNRLCTSLV